MKTVLISLFSNVPYWNTPDSFLKRLKKQFPDYIFLKSEGKKDYLEKLRRSDILCTWRVKREDIPNNINQIVFCAAGVPNNFKYKDFEGIEIIKFPGINTISVSEYIIGIVFLLFKKYDHFIENKKRLWEARKEIIPETIQGKIVTILGVGHIGLKVAEHLQSFGMTVYGTKRTAIDTPFIKKIYHPAEMYEPLPKSDLVISTLPFNETTRRSIGEKEFFSIKKGGYFINVSRGGILREEALIKALKEKYLAAAALDVFQMEPLPDDSPLLKVKNLILTPHIAGAFATFWDTLYEYLVGML
jgi:phosphoglycerate dehydrogenase-like enzyme